MAGLDLTEKLKEYVTQDNEKGRASPHGSRIYGALLEGAKPDGPEKIKHDGQLPITPSDVSNTLGGSVISTNGTTISLGPIEKVRAVFEGAKIDGLESLELGTKLQVTESDLIRALNSAPSSTPSITSASGHKTLEV